MLFFMFSFWDLVVCLVVGMFNDCGSCGWGFVRVIGGGLFVFCVTVVLRGCFEVIVCCFVYSYSIIEYVSTTKWVYQ